MASVRPPVHSVSIVQKTVFYHRVFPQFWVNRKDSFVKLTSLLQLHFIPSPRDLFGSRRLMFVPNGYGVT
jgi:hypothetical protein